MWTKQLTKGEFDCKETGENGMQPEFMAKLQALRMEYGRPMTITSGYRSPKHSKEVKKASPGWHTKGLAVDIACHSNAAYEIVRLAMKHGFTGIGVSQRDGIARFVHLDMRTDTPRVYSY
jgi:uncharacterized protein YcbK (DUF882 family)